MRCCALRRIRRVGAMCGASTTNDVDVGFTVLLRDRRDFGGAAAGSSGLPAALWFVAVPGFEPGTSSCSHLALPSEGPAVSTPRTRTGETTGLLVFCLN